jgi:hypothetical protein
MVVLRLGILAEDEKFPGAGSILIVAERRFESGDDLRIYI